MNYGDTHTRAYAFDAMGNRTSYTVDGGTPEGSTYNAANMLLTRGGQSYTNDAAGNTTVDGVTGRIPRTARTDADGSVGRAGLVGSRWDREAFGASAGSGERSFRAADGPVRVRPYGPRYRGGADGRRMVVGIPRMG